MNIINTAVAPFIKVPESGKTPFNKIKNAHICLYKKAGAKKNKKCGYIICHIMFMLIFFNIKSRQNKNSKPDII